MIKQNKQKMNKKDHQPISDVFPCDTRSSFFFHQTELNEDQFVQIYQSPGQEKLKKKRLSLRHAEADVSSTVGRGTRWSER